MVRSASAPHPSGTEVDPAAWWQALQSAIDGVGGLADVEAVSVGGQQHGMVCLDATGEVVRKALLWNDTRSAGAADDLIQELGGAARWAAETGLVPVASFTATKLRWLADNEPDNADRTAAVCLPHDWLTWRLAGSGDIEQLYTDRSDASGTGYYSAADNSYKEELLLLATRGRLPRVPQVLGPHDSASTLRDATAKLGPGAGDNAAAALGLGAASGDCVMSLGTSGVISAVGEVASHDADGIVAGFADATGRQLPLVCTLNGAPVLAAVAQMLGVDLSRFSDLALSAQPGAEGLVWVPYFDGERSPNLPDARGALQGASTTNLSPANVARAAVEGLLCSMAYCLDKIAEQGVDVDRVLMVGGGAHSAAVRQLAPAVLGRPVEVPTPGEYVALGAAKQAAWVLAGGDSPPQWVLEGSQTYTAESTPHVVEQYQVARGLTLGQRISAPSKIMLV